ncbi:hypothetical protein [Trichothermofontia sp.]
MKLLLVCSEGEPFEALHELKAFWQKHDRCWVTIAAEASESQLATETVFWLIPQGGKSRPNLPTHRCHTHRPTFYGQVCLWLWALQMFYRERPHLILSTGAELAVPFLILGKLLGSRTAFVESITQVSQLSPTAQRTLPFLDMLYVHWAQLKQRYPKSVLISGHTLQ